MKIIASPKALDLASVVQRNLGKNYRCGRSPRGLGHRNAKRHPQYTPFRKKDERISFI